MNGFERIIANLDPDARVLDVGAWGLAGKNTSEAIERKFHDVEYMNITMHDKVTLVADYYSHQFTEQFDIMVLDLHREYSYLSDWTDGGLAKAWSLLKPGGIFITYLAGDLDYQMPDLSRGWRLKAILPDGREGDRKTIFWIALIKE